LKPAAIVVCHEYCVGWSFYPQLGAA